MREKTPNMGKRLRVIRNILIVSAVAQFIALIVLIFIYFITKPLGWS